MTKEEAETEALKRWHELPVSNQTVDNATEFAKVLLPVLTFETLGHREKVIAAWLLRDVDRRNAPGPQS